MKRRNFVSLLAVALWTGAAFGAEGRITHSDVAEIRQVIHRQIDAFRRDDAPGAFALVSPGVQHSFGTPERFLDAVRIAYQAVSRAANVAFLDLLVMSGEVVQPVQLTDPSGGVWLAYFSMQRQSDGSWRMNGCHLAPPARPISA